MRTLLDGLRSSMTVQVLWDLAAQNYPVSSVYGWDPVELCLAAQCLRQVSVKIPHEDVANVWIVKIVAVCRRRKGHHCTSWFAHDCRHSCTLWLAHDCCCLVKFTGIFLPPSFHWDVQYTYRLLVPRIAGLGRCSPGYGNNVVNLHPVE
jgi:hypothetical protein